MAYEDKRLPQLPLAPANEEHQPTDRVLPQQRQQSGGLADDPTDSGEPVKEKTSFRITRSE